MQLTVLLQRLIAYLLLLHALRPTAGVIAPPLPVVRPVPLTACLLRHFRSNYVMFAL